MNSIEQYKMKNKPTNLNLMNLNKRFKSLTDKIHKNKTVLKNTTNKLRRIKPRS